MSGIRSISLAAALAAASHAASAAPTIINFDTDGFGAPIAANTPITSQYANLGVQFAGIEDGFATNVNAGLEPSSLAPSFPNVMTNCADASTFCPSIRADIIRVTFAAPVSGLSLLLNSFGASAVTFNLYDAADVLLETRAAAGGVSYIPIVFAATGVSRIDALQPSEAWQWAFDDLTFTRADSTVPAPAAFSLLAIGLAGLAAARRR